MTAPQIYELIDMKIESESEPLIGVRVSGIVAKVPQGFPSSFSHLLLIDEARNVARTLLEKEEERDELRDAPLIFRALISDVQTDEWLLVPFFFPLPGARASSRIRMSYEQAQNYGQQIQDSADSASRLQDDLN